MSGIAGCLNLDGAPVGRDLLERMTGALASRGPDARHVWIDGHVGFGHALLRTTWEAENERQPHTLDGKTWITADCRVDGREDLIRELTGHGQAPDKDAPDPNLILRAYAVWGEGCVDRLLGDFAFAIWDGPRQALFCARDRFGVKPFSYACVGSTIVFSNTLNCVRLHRSVSARLNERWVADYLVYGHPLESDISVFADIARLPPAHTLTVSGGQVRRRRYWEMPLEEEIRYRRRSEYIEHFRGLLDEAVADRLRTGSVGVLMSGGLDSTTVAAAARRVSRRAGSATDLCAHTVVYDRIVPDEERKYSSLAAEAIGIPIRHWPMDDHRFPSSEPDPKGYPPEPDFPLHRGNTVRLHREILAGTRVLLRGEGADHLVDMPPGAVEGMLRQGQYGRLLRELSWAAWTLRRIPRAGLRSWLLARLHGQPAPVCAQSFPVWLQPDLERRLELRGRWRAYNTAVDPRPGFELVAAFYPWLFEGYDPGMMELAGEVRYPFLDLRLVRYLLRVPAVPWGAEKCLLRTAMKGVLPVQVLRRPKTPIAGNPFAAMLPPAATAWWERYLVPAPGLEDFVVVAAVRKTLANTVPRTQSVNDHEDINALRSSLRPIELNLWLQQLAAPDNLRARESPPFCSPK